MDKILKIINLLEAEYLIENKSFDEALDILLNCYENNEYINLSDILYKISECYINLNDYKNAILYLEKLIEIEPQNIFGLYNIAICYFYLNDYFNSLKYFNKIKDFNKKDSNIDYYLGICYLYNNEIDKSLVYLENYLFEDGESDKIIKIVSILLNKSLISELKQLFLKYLDSTNDKNNISINYGLGLAYFNNKEYDKAVYYLKKVIENDKLQTNLSVYCSLSMALFQLGDKNKAIETLHQAIKLDPNYYEFWYYLGNIYFLSEDYQRAINFFRNSIDIEPNFADVWEKLGIAYLKLKKYNQAKNSYLEYFRLTNKKMVLYKLGLISMMMEDYHDAVKYFLQLKENDLPEIYENITLCYYYLNDYENTILYGKLAIEKNIKYDCIFYYAVGNTLLKKKNYDLARRFFIEGLKYYPNDYSLLYATALTYANRSDYNNAKLYMEKAYNLEKKPDSVYTLYLIEKYLGNISKAVILLDEYLKFYKDNPDELYKISMEYLNLNQYDKALYSLNLLLKLEPDREEITSFINYIKNINKLNNKIQ